MREADKMHKVIGVTLLLTAGALILLAMLAGPVVPIGFVTNPQQTFAEGIAIAVVGLATLVAGGRIEGEGK
jgi:hypothetical protein